MHALIVFAHPDSTSHTHAVAKQIAEGIASAGEEHTFELVDGGGRLRSALQRSGLSAV